MRQPQFQFEQFVDNNMLNTAMNQLHQSDWEVGSSVQPFLLPGVINPSNIIFTFSNNLTVGVNAQNSSSVTQAVGCLFSSGAIAHGHGITNGTDSSTTTVNFTSLVPGAGSVTAYIVAAYAQVQLDSTTIIGAPPGHPDYAANFVPYIGYTRLEDTLNITATTTLPDNLVFIELARFTLSHGQTVINAVDTSHQVLASVNAKSVILGGDVTGNSGANTISNLQGKPVSAANPGVGNVLEWNGSNWVPVAGTFPPSGPASGDLVGSYPNPTVLQSSSNPFTALHNMTVAGNLSVNGGGTSSIAGALQAFSFNTTGANAANIFNSGAISTTNTIHSDGANTAFSYAVNGGAASIFNSGNINTNGNIVSAGTNSAFSYSINGGAANIFNNGNINTNGNIASAGTNSAFSYNTSGGGHANIFNSGAIVTDNTITASGADGQSRSIIAALNIVSNSGEFIGNNATVTNACPILNQFPTNSGFTAATATNTAGYFGIPTINSLNNQLITLYVFYGFHSWVGLGLNQVANTAFPISFSPGSFPTTCLWASATFGTDFISGAGAMVVNGVALEVQNASLTQFGMTVFADFIAANTSINQVAIAPGGLTGFYWIAIGY